MKPEAFFDDRYKYKPGDVVFHKGTQERIVVLFHLPLDDLDLEAGMEDKYHVRRPCGRRTAYYGLELVDKDPKKEKLEATC